MTASKAIAFLSYAHEDDEPPQRPITMFREELTKALRRYLGEDDIEIFHDVVSISWGERWRERIGNSLNEIVFFIPVMSPRYFASGPCRAEAEAFLTRERHVGRPDLLLPVYFIDYSMHLSRASDDLVQAFEDHQYVDWREYRLSKNSAARRRAFDRLGHRIASAILRPDRESTIQGEQTRSLEIPQHGSIEEAERDDTVAIGEGYLLPGDTDIFDVLLTADDSYVVYVEREDTSVDFNLIVKDQQGDIIGPDTDEDADPMLQFTPVESGFFTFEVTSFRGASGYHIVIAPASSLVEDGDEWDDGSEMVYSGVIAGGEDHEILIDLTGGAPHRIWLSPESFALEINLAVYDDDGRLIADDSAAEGVCEFTPARSDAFRLVVSATRGVGGYTMMMRVYE